MIHEAYETLSDPDLRRAYDKLLDRSGSKKGAGGGDSKKSASGGDSKKGGSDSKEGCGDTKEGSSNPTTDELWYHRYRQCFGLLCYASMQASFPRPPSGADFGDEFCPAVTLCFFSWVLSYFIMWGGTFFTQVLLVVFGGYA